ncbi:MAG: DUF1311 domain-containing protein [Pseudomonadota bacterium]
MKIITFLAFSFFIQSCVASEICDNPETQYQMNICSGNKLSDLENKLKTKVSSTSKQLKKIKGDKLFIESNNAWFKFRDLHCESLAHIYESGSIHSLIESECKTILTKERINNISRDYKDTLDTISEDGTSANN